MSLREGRPRGTRQRAGLDRHVAHQVPHRAHRFALRAVVRRRHDHPGRRHRQVAPVERDLRRHRPVRDVVVPAFVVGEGDGAAAVIRRRLAVPAQHDQPPRIIRENLAEIDRRIHEAPVVELRRRRVRARDGACRRGDRELRAVGDGGVAQRARRRAGCFRNVERDLKPIPCRLGVRELHRPRHLGAALAGQLAHDLAAHVHAIDAEACGLALQPAFAVPIESGRLRRRLVHLRPEEPFARTAADARDADRRIDRRADDAVIRQRRWRLGRARRGRIGQRLAVRRVTGVRARHVDRLAHRGDG